MGARGCSAATSLRITDIRRQLHNNNGAGPIDAVISGFTPGFNGGTNTSWVDFNTDFWGYWQLSWLAQRNRQPISNDPGPPATLLASLSSPVAGILTSPMLPPMRSVEPMGTRESRQGNCEFRWVFMTDGIGSGFRFDLLVAYTNSSGGTNIADIQLNQATTDYHIGGHLEHASDLVTLKGVALTNIVGSVLGSHDVIHFNGASP